MMAIGDIADSFLESAMSLCSRLTFFIDQAIGILSDAIVQQVGDCVKKVLQRPRPGHASRAIACWLLSETCWVALIRPVPGGAVCTAAFSH